MRLFGIALCGWAATWEPLDARQLHISPRLDVSASVFVAVLSRRNASWRRDHIRGMWQHAREVSGQGVIVKFVVCNRGGEGENSWTDDDLKTESTMGDLAFLNCSEEGSGRGALTRQVLRTMEMYIRDFDSDYFMKIEDDTFISWRRYLHWMKQMSHENLYMGVQVGETLPCRDETHLGYEPISTYTKDVFPRSMSAGSGYTLSRSLVDAIVSTGLGRSNILYNEDKSVGLWIQMLEQSGVRVRHASIPGVEGFWAWDTRQHAQESFSSYNNVVHHGLEASTIGCLSLLDIAEDNTTVIDDCFKPELQKVRTESVCPSMRATPTRFVTDSDPKHVSVFVAVFSKRDDVTRRSKVRSMWNHARDDGGHVTVRFAVCSTPSSSEMSWVNQGIETEKRTDDVIMLDCADDENAGDRTRKLLSIMGHYVKSHANDYFMKIEDDTFISWKRYVQLLRTYGHAGVYMGVQSTEMVPCRDSKSELYEPWWTFQGSRYPVTMSGNDGYTIGRDLVEIIVKSGLGEKQILFNEDRAVAVWMKSLVDVGYKIEYVDLADRGNALAVDAIPSPANASLLVTHPRLDAETIECFFEADVANRLERQSDDCLKMEFGKSQATVCASTDTARIGTISSLSAGFATQHMSELYRDQFSPTTSDAHMSTEDQPSVFVAVPSRRNTSWRRQKIRSMWRNAQETSGGRVIVKFIICNGAVDGEIPWVEESLNQEADIGDLAFLDCEESHDRGALTRKLLAAMQFYVDNFQSSYFMKIDDDTFISWRRYDQLLKSEGTPRLYMGVEIGEARPCRNESFLWYEPFETFKDSTFPKSMAGGSGYTLGRELVESIVSTDLGRSNILYNEDRSVGLWVKMIEDSGKQVKFVGIDGIDGFWAWNWTHPQTAFSTWAEFNKVVFHGLEAETIECLASLEAVADQSKLIGECLKREESKGHPSLVCSSLAQDHDDEASVAFAATVSPASGALFRSLASADTSTSQALSPSPLWPTTSDESSLSVFVAVFSRRSGTWRRNKIRAMWDHARSSAEVNATVKFAVCEKEEEGEMPWVNQSLQDEVRIGDVLLLDCDEGYGKSALTRKLLAAMSVYAEHTREKYFMKIDDDTFISWKRYVELLKTEGTPGLYMGVEIGEGKPCRNESYLWYEPYDTFSGDIFPKAMSGGSGYTLGRDLVDIIVKTDLGKSNILYNEDRSVGLWAKMIEDSGKEVKRVGINGIDGFWAWDWGSPLTAFSTIGSFTKVVFHGLEAETIECLANLTVASDDSKRMDECLKPEVGKYHEKLVCSSLPPAASTPKPETLPHDDTLSLAGLAPEHSGVSVFVAVLSRRNSTLKRNQIRSMWEHARSSTEASVSLKYVVCVNAEVGEQPSVNQSLNDENSKGDLLLLDCDEGYGKGALTKKTLAAMHVYVEHFSENYFMRIDDDTFVSWKRYVELLKTEGTPRLYMGVEIGEEKPCRNESYLLYEPFATFKGDIFPKAMSGGSGYTLGRDLVDIIVKTDLGKSNILYNEDRSVGLWTKMIEDSGKEVKRVGINGIDGFWAWDWGSPLTAFSTIGSFTKVVFHGLEAESIDCLARLDIANNDSVQIGECLTPEVGKHHEPLVCSSTPSQIDHEEDENVTRNAHDVPAEVFSTTQANSASQVSVFVAVFSRRDGSLRRNKTRAMWQAARSSPAEAIVKFVVCANEENGEDPWVNKSLQDENGDGDLLLIDCEEGSGNGALTRKLLAAMSLYVGVFRNSYFLKINDDTFISWKRYVELLKTEGTPRLYMGVEIGEEKPCRNESNLLYEPYDTFKGDIFPKAMSGGSGYTLGRDLVDIIVKTDLGKSNILYNEDRAVGLWTKMIEDSGKEVKRVSIDGIDNSSASDWGSTLTALSADGNFQTVVLHGLEAETIECLASLDIASNENTQITGCFKAEAGKSHEKLVCSPSAPHTEDNVAVASTSIVQSLSTDAQPQAPDALFRTQASQAWPLWQEAEGASVFVAVFSRRNATWRRDKIRAMWEHARSSSAVNVTVKFAVCKNKEEGEIPWVDQVLDEEERIGDLLLLDCDEGRSNGGLTKKLLAAMSLYVDAFQSSYFMKIDDDTFISWKRYLNRLMNQSTPSLYMGVDVGEGKPCRNESHLWYEPYDTFKGDTFPRAMSGGSGYTLGRDLVNIIVKTDLGKSNILFNEDRAVGLWMMMIEDSGREVTRVGIDGIDDYWAWDSANPLTAFSTVDKFEKVVFHGLEAETIECLARLDIAGDKNDQLGDCMKPEVSKHLEKLGCS